MELHCVLNFLDQPLLVLIGLVKSYNNSNTFDIPIPLRQLQFSKRLVVDYVFQFDN